MSNQEDSNKAELNNLSPDERQKKFDNFAKVFDSFVYRINEGVTSTYDDIKELAERLEEIVPKFMVSGEIKKRIKLLREKDKSIHITDKMIDDALSDEYKELTKGRAEKKKVAATTGGITVTEDSTSHLKSDETLNDYKKDIEESHTNNTPQTNPPMNYDNDEPTDEQLEQMRKEAEQQQETKTNLPPKDKAFEELARPLVDEVKTLREKVKVLEQEKENVIKVKNEVLQKAAPKKFTPRTNTPLQINDKAEFEQNLELDKTHASWVAATIREYLAKFPKIDYFLIQTNSNGKIRVNVPKTDFLT